MHTISRRNVNDAYPDGLWYLKINGNVEESRNGRVIVAPNPVVNVYHNPRERVLFDSVRDANPFFHFFESLWMLAGRQDVDYVAQFVSRMRDYSEDGVILEGAYGYRWRHKFGYDQITWVIDHLHNEPESRRAVITMWDPSYDIAYGSKDLPCNTQVYVSLNYRNTEPEVDISVCCRSNDAIWGCYGANVVHMSFLQEYIACALKMNVGRYTQFSHNFHVYPDMPRFEKMWAAPGDGNNLYALTKEIQTGPELFTGDHRKFYSVLRGWLEKPDDELTSYPFLSVVAYPMWQAFKFYKDGSLNMANQWAGQIAAPDWNYACVSWLHRRGEK
jgi:hypothetical protein